jgi:hypothetical protein
MFSWLTYLFYSAFITPNSNTQCYTTDVCPIQWNTNEHAHLAFEMQTNDGWVSSVDSQQHFLSIIIDESVTNYDWNVPWYLSQYWKNPKRMVMKNLDSDITEYSDNFTILGVTFDISIPTSLIYNETIPISWSTNDNSSFRLELVDSNKMNTLTPVYYLDSNETYYWPVPDYQSSNLMLQLISMNNKSIDYSNHFSITVPTSTTTTVTTTVTTSITSSNTAFMPTEATLNNDFPLWAIIVIACGTALILCILTYILTKKCNKNKRIISPVTDTSTSVNKKRPVPAFINQIYEGKNNLKRQSVITNPVYERPEDFNKELQLAVKRVANPLYRSADDQ